MPKRILSVLKPTGRPHLGNYLGAIRQHIALQDEGHECLYFVADYHALTTVHKAEDLKNYRRGVVLDYLALGLDPEKVTFFYQSDIPEHAELEWILSCVTPHGLLERAHAWKDALAKGTREMNVGLFTYPVLMAADILMYQADWVPVGQDQKQHVEIARDTAEKFNRLFGETFKMPEPLILDSVKTVPGIDGQKMSKSYGNTIPLFAEDAEIKKLVMSIVTDSAGGRPENVYQIHKLFKPVAELDKLYAEKEGKYQALKEALIEDAIAFITPLRERRATIAAKPDEVITILTNGAGEAREQAKLKMTAIRQAVGLDL